MLNNIKRIFLFIGFYLPIICPTTCFAWHDYTGDGDWNYHGSGRDHPYSAYIDRDHYVGYADYAPIEPAYVDGPLYLSAPVVASAPPLSTPLPPPDEFTVNVPNNDGSYTAVIIKRSGSGFIGPQGEYYPEFPKIFQLKIMYGK